MTFVAKNNVLQIGDVKIKLNTFKIKISNSQSTTNEAS